MTLNQVLEIRKSKIRINTHTHLGNAHFEKRNSKNRPEKLVSAQKLRFVLKSNFIYAILVDTIRHDERTAINQKRNRQIILMIHKL